MSKLQLSDITDELIKPVVISQDAYFADADNYLLSILQGFDGTKAITDIKDPMPFQVKALAIARVCYRVCEDKFGGQVGLAFKGQDGGDRWYTKLKHYESVMNSLSSSMTLELMTGASTTSGGYYSMQLERG